MVFIEYFFEGFTRAGRLAVQCLYRCHSRMIDARLAQGGKVSQRHWIMTRLDDHRYTATLSDADGPVTAEVYGNLFHLRYLLKKPFVTMEQWLYLQSDGKTVLNEGTIRMPGRTIARLSEIIVRQGE